MRNGYAYSDREGVSSILTAIITATSTANYDIQKMSEGYYYFIQFEAEATVPAAVEQDVRIMDNVLRFLCVRKDEA